MSLLGLHQIGEPIDSQIQISQDLQAPPLVHQIILDNSKTTVRIFYL